MANYRERLSSQRPSEKVPAHRQRIIDSNRRAREEEPETAHQLRRRLVKHRNVQLAAMLICLLERVAQDPRQSAEHGYAVVEKLPKDATTSAEALYASLLLTALTDDTPGIEPKVREALKKYKWWDGSTAYNETAER